MKVGKNAVEKLTGKKEVPKIPEDIIRSLQCIKLFLKYAQNKGLLNIPVLTKEMFTREFLNLKQVSYGEKLSIMNY